jgi:hypothetical protein
MSKNAVLAALAAGVLLPASAMAAAPFQAELVVNNNVGVDRSFTRLDDLINQFSNTQLAAVDPAYTPVSAAQAAVNLRGLSGVTLGYAANSPLLVMNIPSLGIHETFGDPAGTRDQSQQALKDFFRGSAGRAVLTRLLDGLAAHSPIDPMAGNPNSLMSVMAAADFNRDANDIVAGMSGTAGAVGGEAAQNPHNFFGAAASFGRYTQEQFKSNVYSLPLSYTHLFTDPRYALLVDLPFTYVNNDGAKSANASMGVGLRFPVNARWSLTPAVRVGLTGSQDLGSAGLVASGGITSNLRLPDVHRVRLDLANMVAYYSTSSIAIGHYDVGYDLKNTVFRNGIKLSGDAGWRRWPGPLTWEFDAVRTDFEGSQVYSRSSNEFAVSLGTRKREGHVVWNALRFGATYTLAEHGIHGFQTNFGYTF